MDARMPFLPQASALMTEAAFDLMYDAEVAAVHAALDTLRAQRDAQRAGLRERHNGRLDVTSSFPPEILSHVFYYLHDSPTMSPKFEPQKHLSWITATHVSRRWRAVALGTGTLWRKLHLAMPAEIWSTFIERTRGSSLVIQGRWDDVDFAQRQDVLLRFERVTELDLRVVKAYQLDDLLTTLLGTTTRLHTVKIHTNFATLLIPAFDNILAHCAPTLRHLTLYGVHFPWGCSVANLQSLHLYDTTLASAPTPFADVMHALASAINLVELSLSGEHIFIPPPSPQSVIPTLSLPRMDSLTLKCSVQHAISLIRALIIPPTSSIRVHVRSPRGEAPLEVAEDERDTTTHTALIASTLAAHISRRDAPQFTVLQIQFHSPCIHLKLGHIPPPSADTEHNGAINAQQSISIQLPVALHIQRDSHSLRAKTLKLARALPMEHTKHLILSSGLFWSRADVVQLLQRATLVEELAIYALGMHGQNASALLHNILSPSTFFSAAGSNDEGFTGVLLPALKKLYLNDIKFKFKAQRNGRDIPLSKILMDAFEYRSRLGCGLQVLRLDRCRHVEDYDVYQLGQIVSDVTYAG